MTNTQKQSMKEHILERIEQQHVRMKPKWHFVLKSMLFILALSVAVLFLLYLVSLILFTLELNGAWFAPSFGFRGVMLFLVSLPWMLVLLSVLLLLVIELLASHFSFAYSKPMIYSLFVVGGVITIGSFGVAKTDIHDKIYTIAHKNAWDIPGTIYRVEGPEYRQGQLVQMGKITEVITNGCIITDVKGKEMVVVVTPETRLPEGFVFDEGQLVVVIGNKKGITTTAFGLRQLSEQRAVHINRVLKHMPAESRGGMFQNRPPMPVPAYE